MSFTWSIDDRRRIYQRGLAIRAIASATFLALFSLVWILDGGQWIPALPSILGILAALVAINPLMLWIAKSRAYPLGDLRFHWAIDVLSVTWFVHCMGTLDMPLAPAAYMIMIVTSATFATMRTAFKLATWSAVCLVTLVVCEEMGLIPHEHVTFAPELAMEGQLINLSGAVLLFFVFAFISGTLAEQLRDKASEVERQKGELEVAYSKEQTAREGITILSALVQHDVYSPLGLVSAACTEAQKSCESGDWVGCGRFIAMIGDRLRMIESAVATLGLFRIGEDKEESCDLNSVAQDVVEDLGYDCSERRIVVSVEGMWPTVYLKREHVYHVLRNLVANSAKCVDDDGTGEIVVSSKGPEGDGSWEIAVSDNGPGLSDEARERLFQLSRPRPDGRLGLGFGSGLALSSNLVRNWGGTIRYRSRDGGGSVFTVTVPRDCRERRLN